MAEPRRAAARPAPRIEGGRFLIVEARFYEAIGDDLLAGARRALEAAGAIHDVVSVDGALEIPAGMAIALDAAESAGRPYDGAVALGCVVRGETFHFEIVAGEVARGADGYVGRAQARARQRNSDDRDHRAGRRARRPRARRQGRRRRARCDRASRSSSAGSAGDEDEEVRSSLRCAPRRLAGALSDGSGGEGAQRHSRGIRGALDRPGDRGGRLQPCGARLFSATWSRACCASRFRSTAASTTRSQRAGRCVESRR